MFRWSNSLAGCKYLLESTGFSGAADDNELLPSFKRRSASMLEKFLSEISFYLSSHSTSMKIDQTFLYNCVFAEHLRDALVSLKEIVCFVD